MLAMPNRISLIRNLLMKTDNLKMPAIEDSLLVKTKDMHSNNTSNNNELAENFFVKLETLFMLTQSPEQQQLSQH